MDNFEYKILITASGTGSRLNELTSGNNKALIKLADKSVLARIIEGYLPHIPLVITIGYKGESIKKYLKETYSTRSISIINVDNYDGQGSSLGYSMLRAKDQLQCPFIFHCNDTLVLDPIPKPDKNWNGGSKGSGLSFQNTDTYSSFSSKRNIITKVYAKGAKKYDYFHIGLVGIYEYKKFWRYLQELYESNPMDKTLNDVYAINQMIKNGSNFKVNEFKKWFDTGSVEGLIYTKSYFK